VATTVVTHITDLCRDLPLVHRCASRGPRMSWSCSTRNAIPRAYRTAPHNSQGKPYFVGTTSNLRQPRAEYPAMESHENAGRKPSSAPMPNARRQ
jgi:hypothetical protein